jgi:hypothetical protein
MSLNLDLAYFGLFSLKFDGLNFAVKKFLQSTYTAQEIFLQYRGVNAL